MTEKHCTLLFLRRGDEILLAMKKRGFGAHLYNGVGGKIDEGETIEQALVRECREEIGVIPMHYWKVAINDFHEFDDGTAHRMIVHTYLCDEWQGEPTESEEMAPAWFPTSEIPYGTMWTDDEFWLPHVLAGNKVTGEFHIDESGNITQHNVQVVESLPDEA